MGRGETTKKKGTAVRNVAFAVALFAFAFVALRSVESDALGGTQQCNTECQSKMTDCVLACDGIRSCEEACKRKAEACVRVCTSDAAPPEAIVDAGGDSESVDVQTTDARPGARRDARAARGDR
jgi:hypothetical protein